MGHARRFYNAMSEAGWYGTLAAIIGIALALAALVAVIVSLFALASAAFLWSVNTLAEQAGWGWHIPHNWRTYLAVCGVLLAFNAPKAEKSR